MANNTNVLPITPITRPRVMLLRRPMRSITYPQAEAAKAEPSRYTAEGTPVQ